MLLKLIALIAAALPIVMFLRRLMAGRKRPTRFSEGMKEFKRQADIAVWIFIALVGAIFAVAAGKLAWSWWSA